MGSPGPIYVAVPGLSFSSVQAGHLAPVGDYQTRVTFDFSGDREVQYLQGIPAVGDFVSHRGALWLVLRIDDDAAGLVVTCELPTRQHA